MQNMLFFGLGRIGLPQSLVFASKGFNIYGYDLDKTVINSLQHKKPLFFEPGIDEYLSKYLGKTFKPIEDWKSVIDQVDAIFFTLGTAVATSDSCLNDDNLDLSNIEKVIDEIFSLKNRLKKGIKLIFRATLPIGTTEKIKNYIEEKYDLTESKDFYMGFVPERLVEGQAIEEEENLPKIIGAFSDDGFNEIKSIFEQVGGKIIRVTDPRTAEFCKLTDNSHRNTTFAFSNELAIWSSRVEVNIKEVINAVNMDYDRNKLPNPGYVSGYCLGKDPYIFEYGFKDIAQKRDFNSLWYYGRRINDFLIDYTVEKILGKIIELNKNPEDIIISVLGMSFKEDIDDFRMSHCITLIEKLLDKGCNKFKIFDPNLDKNKYTKIPENINNYIISKDNKICPELFQGSSVILIAHRHQSIREVNNKNILKNLLSKVYNPVYIFDGWNIWDEAKDIDGIIYESLGYCNKISNKTAKQQLNPISE